MNKKLNLYIGLSQLMLLLLLCSCSSNPDSPGSEYMPDMYRSPAIESYVDYGEIRGRENMEIKTQLSARQTPKYTVPYERIYARELADLKKKKADLAEKDPTDSLDIEIERVTQRIKMMLPNKIKAGIGWRESHGLYGWDLASENGYDAARSVTVNPINMTIENAETIVENGEKLYKSMCAHCHGEKGDGNGTMIQSGAYGDLGVVPAYKALDTLSEGKIYYSIYYGKGYMGAHGSLLNKKEIWTLVHYVRQFQRDGYGKIITTELHNKDKLRISNMISGISEPFTKGSKVILLDENEELLDKNPNGKFRLKNDKEKSFVRVEKGIIVDEWTENLEEDNK